MMKIIPAKNRLLLEKMKREETTHSGIVLTPSAQEETVPYRIVATADCVDEDQEIYLRGSVIFVAPGMGVEVQADGKQYLIIEQKDVIAIVE